MGEKVKASVHSQRGGYSLAHNDGSLYHEDDEKFKRGRRGNVHINPDGTELTGGRQVGATVKAAREWYKARLGGEYERAVHSDGWKRNPGRRKTFDEFCDMKRNQMNETILQVGNIETTFDTTPALRAGLKAVNEWQADLNARAAANGSKACIETVAIDLHLDESPHAHKIDAVLADDGTMNMDAALKDMGIEKAHPPRKMIKPKGKRKARPETDKEYERRCTRVSTYTAEMRGVFEDAVDQWFAENGYDIRLDRERSDSAHMELDEFRATHQRAYEQGVAAAEAEADDVLARAQNGYFPATDEDGNETVATVRRIAENPREGFFESFPKSLPVGSTVVQDGRKLTVTGEFVPGARFVEHAAERGAKATREAAEADAKRVREEAARNAQAVYDDALAEAHLALVEEREGDELEAAHERHVLALKRADVAEREQLLDERVALVNERSDDVRRREDAVAEREAEATRLLDGYDREATIADFMPELPPDADEGERAAADERARKAFAGACFRNGLKPPTVHVPGLREREAELTRQERELVPLLKAVRAFIEDPVTFVADALRRVQGYIAEVAHSEGTDLSQQLTNEMMNDAINDATRLMYAHPSDPRMREACAPDAPALRDDERAAPIFDADAWLEDRRRRRAAQRVATIPRQSLQQRLAQQPEQQPVYEVLPDYGAPKPSRGYDGPEM